MSRLGPDQSQFSSIPQSLVGRILTRTSRMCFDNEKDLVTVPPADSTRNSLYKTFRLIFINYIQIEWLNGLDTFEYSN